MGQEVFERNIQLQEKLLPRMFYSGVVSFFQGKLPRNFNSIVVISILYADKHVVIIRLHCLEQQNEKHKSLITFFFVTVDISILYFLFLSLLVNLKSP